MSSSKERLSRRDILKIIGVGAAGAAGAGLVIKKAYEEQNRSFEEIERKSAKPTATKEITPEPEVSSFRPPDLPEKPEIKIRQELERDTEWNYTRLQNELLRAVKESVDQQTEKVVILPEGETLVDETIKLVVPKDAKIKIIGQGENTRLRLSEELARIPKEWGSRENNLLYIENYGEVSLENLDFDGGSNRAGEGGYEAPPSPWNSIVYVGNQAEKIQGITSVSDCRFYNSESVGFVAENLRQAKFNNLTGKNLDGLVTVNWSDRVEGNNLLAVNCLSDGLYIVECLSGKISDSLVYTARQGYDLHGCDNLSVDNCHAIDCAEGFTISKSQRGDGRNSKNITLTDCHSEDCGFIYAFGFIDGCEVTTGYHDKAGEWFSHQDFMHLGVERYEDLNHATVWNDPNSAENVNFENVMIRKSELAPEDYKKIEEDGIKYFAFDK